MDAPGRITPWRSDSTRGCRRRSLCARCAELPHTLAQVRQGPPMRSGCTGSRRGGATNDAAAQRRSKRFITSDLRPPETFRFAYRRRAFRFQAIVTVATTAATATSKAECKETLDPWGALKDSGRPRGPPPGFPVMSGTGLVRGPATRASAEFRACIHGPYTTAPRRGRDAPGAHRSARGAGPSGLRHRPAALDPGDAPLGGVGHHSVGGATTRLVDL